jgi:hypothetical protein
MSDPTLTATGAQPRWPGAAAGDSRALIARCLRLSLRNVDGLITALVLPIMLMLMFVYLFGGALRTGTSYVNYVVPGVLLVCAGFGTATTAVTVAHDMTGGIIDRFRSMGTPASALLTGHPALAADACSRKAASSIPGTLPTVMRAILVMVGWPSMGRSVTVASVCTESGGVPA